MWLERAEDRPEMVRQVARNMREWDRREIFATRIDDDADALALDVLACGPVAWVAGAQDDPIAAFGCAPMWSGVWSLWLFATDNLHTVGLDVTRLIVRTIVPMLWEAGAHRLEARSMEGHSDAQRWLKTIGAAREATLSGYGRGGEDFHVYTWTKP